MGNVISLREAIQRSGLSLISVAFRYCLRSVFHPTPSQLAHRCRYRASHQTSWRLQGVCWKHEDGQHIMSRSLVRHLTTLKLILDTAAISIELDSVIT